MARAAELDVSRFTVVYEQPPVSQGFMVLEMLNIAEAWPMHDGDHDSRRRFIYQVARQKTRLRGSYSHLEDPAFGDPKIRHVDIERIRGQAARVGWRGHEPPGAAVATQSSDTTYLCATDRDGNAISFIQSVFAPFGSRVIAGDTGVIMNNRLCSFGLDPNKANSLQPGKRPGAYAEHLHGLSRQ